MLLAAACACQTVVVQAPDTATAATLPGVMNRMMIALDAAHGGADNGARIGEAGHNPYKEKDVTLALALRLQTLLSARGFTVVMTRTADAADANGATLTQDGRAGILNRARASACLLLHATGSGHGVHLYSSEMDGIAMEPAVMPWAIAQAAWVAESARLERHLAASLRQAGVPRIAGRASVLPIDSLTCPAVVVELGPEGEDPRSVSDPEYQQRVAEGLAGALEAWSKMAQPPPRQSLEYARPRTAKPSVPTATPSATAPSGVQR